MGAGYGKDMRTGNRELEMEKRNRRRQPLYGDGLHAQLAGAGENSFFKFAGHIGTDGGVGPAATRVFGLAEHRHLEAIGTATPGPVYRR